MRRQKQRFPAVDRMTPHQALTDWFEDSLFFVGKFGRPELSPRIHVRMAANEVFDLGFEPASRAS
jgi:hypothetical protein